MDVVQFISSFFTYYPVIVIFIAGATLFNLGARVCQYCGVHCFVETSSYSDEFVAEGRVLSFSPFLFPPLLLRSDISYVVFLYCCRP